MRQPSSLYKRHRFPGEVISHAVWLYFRFLLSYRDVEDLLAERGIAVSYETIRRWCRTFGQRFADGRRRRRRCPGGKWHCDDVPLKINERTRWRRQAVDEGGVVLDILVRPRRKPGGRPEVREIYAKTRRECRERLDELKRQAARGLLPAGAAPDSVAAT